MAVNITATFKKDTVFLNGLEAIHDDLIAEPTTVVLVVAIVEVKKIVTDVDEGTKTPRVKFREIEPLFGDDAANARDMMTRAFKARTGRDAEQELPFPTGDNADQDGEEKDPTAGPWPGDVNFKAPE